MSRKREANPLSFLPSTWAIKRRLAKTEEEARKLRVLLETASKIESGNKDNPRDFGRAQDA